VVAAVTTQFSAALHQQVAVVEVVQLTPVKQDPMGAQEAAVVVAKAVMLHQRLDREIHRRLPQVKETTVALVPTITLLQII